MKIMRYIKENCLYCMVVVFVLISLAFISNLFIQDIRLSNDSNQKKIERSKDKEIIFPEDNNYEKQSGNTKSETDVNENYNIYERIESFKSDNMNNITNSFKNNDKKVDSSDLTLNESKDVTQNMFVEKPLVHEKLSTYEKQEEMAKELSEKVESVKSIVLSDNQSNENNKGENKVITHVDEISPMTISSFKKSSPNEDIELPKEITEEMIQNNDSEFANYTGSMGNDAIDVKEFFDTDEGMCSGLLSDVYVSCKMKEMEYKDEFIQDGILYSPYTKELFLSYDEAFSRGLELISKDKSSDIKFTIVSFDGQNQIIFVKKTAIS